MEFIRELFGSVGKYFGIDPPFQFDYGYNIHLKNIVYFNVNCVVLDGNRVEIGNNVMFGPSVHIYTVTHPIDPKERLTYRLFTSPVKIGNNVWIGGHSTILPGISIGNNSTIGAGSVVTKDIPDNVVAVGNPCNIIKKI